jgi:hypothetical protein
MSEKSSFPKQHHQQQLHQHQNQQKKPQQQQQQQQLIVHEANVKTSPKWSFFDCTHHQSAEAKCNYLYQPFWPFAQSGLEDMLRLTTYFSGPV